MSLYGMYKSVYAPEFYYTETMRATGWKLVRNGHLRRYYDLFGTLRAAYSYNACIYTCLPYKRIASRHVVNLTTYSKTTTDHQNAVLQELCGQFFTRGMWTDGWRSRDQLPAEFRTAIDFFDLGGNISHVSLVDLARVRCPEEKAA